MLDEEARGPLNVDAAAQNPGDILLRVKSANHPSCEDLEFHAQASFSVKQIKEAIQRLSAQHPEVKEQRLIYSGHLLDDNQLLKDVLNANNGSQVNPPQQAVTIHLACTSKYIFSSSSPSSTRIGGPKPGNNGHPINTGIPQQPVFTNPDFSPPNMEIPQVGGGIPQDVLTLHQAYVEQMTAYMNQWYMYQGGMGGMFYQIPQPPVGNYGPPAPAVNPFQPRNEAPPVPNRAQDNVAAARQLDDDENQRDLLDWMYTLSRVVLVFSVVYFYSSFSRFFLVVVFTALVMILQRRNPQGNQNQNVDAPQRDINPQPQRQEPNPPRQPEVNEAGEANRLIPEDENEGRRNESEDQERDASQQSPVTDNSEANPEHNEEPVNNEPPRQNIREIALTFLTTFFTSLIPETYQNNN